MKRVYYIVGLLLLFVIAAFVPVLFWVYVGVGGFLVAAVLVRDHFVTQRPVGVDARFFGSSGRMRRANVGELRFWRLLPSKRLLLVFVGFSVCFRFCLLSVLLLFSVFLFFISLRFVSVYSSVFLYTFLVLFCS